MRSAGWVADWSISEASEGVAGHGMQGALISTVYRHKKEALEQIA